MNEPDGGTPLAALPVTLARELQVERTGTGTGPDSDRGSGLDAAGVQVTSRPAVTRTLPLAAAPCPSVVVLPLTVTVAEPVQVFMSDFDATALNDELLILGALERDGLLSSLSDLSATSMSQTASPGQGGSGKVSPIRIIPCQPASDSSESGGQRQSVASCGPAHWQEPHVERPSRLSGYLSVERE